MLPVCASVNRHEDTNMSYINTSEQRDDSLTRALSVQKWFDALEFFL